MNEQMQIELQKLVEGLRTEGGVDLKETPVIFKWAYENDPWVVYELLIRESDQAELELIDDSDDIEGESVH